jgi:hypothetical protein
MAAHLFTIAFVLGAAVTPANAMTMRVADDQVIVSGALEPADVETFAALLDANPSITTAVLWNSPGGAFEANRGLTKLIVDRKLKTAVAGFCMSACAMVFLSGKERYFSDGESLKTTMLAFHGSYAGGHLMPEERLQFLAGVVASETGGKADPALVQRWLHLPLQIDTVRFFYPGPDGTPKVDTVAECDSDGPYGPGNPSGDISIRCAPIPGPNALSMGIITSTRILHVAH